VFILYIVYGDYLISGDSGGPLSKKISVPILDGKERVFQIGIVSSGSPASCGYEGRPLINTNVRGSHSALEFSLEAIRENTDNCSFFIFIGTILRPMDSQ